MVTIPCIVLGLSLEPGHTAPYRRSYTDLLQIYSLNTVCCSCRADIKANMTSANAQSQCSFRQYQGCSSPGLFQRSLCGIHAALGLVCTCRTHLQIKLAASFEWRRLLSTFTSLHVSHVRHCLCHMCLSRLLHIKTSSSAAVSISSICSRRCHHRSRSLELLDQRYC